MKYRLQLRFQYEGHPDPPLSVRPVDESLPISSVSALLSPPAQNNCPTISDSRFGTNACSSQPQTTRSTDHLSLLLLYWPSLAATPPTTAIEVRQKVLFSPAAHPPYGVDCRIQQYCPTPSLRRHYSRFIATTSWSALEPCIGTCSLAFLHLASSLFITVRVLPVPRTRQNQAHAISTPDTDQPARRPTVGLVPGPAKAPGFDVAFSVTMLARWFTCIRLLDSHLTCLGDKPFPLTLTTTVFSQCRSAAV